MPHGRPDWYNITPMIQVHASEDVNEGAARLGSPSAYDRRGNVIFMHRFDQGVAAAANVGEALAYAVNLSTEYARFSRITLHSVVDVGIDKSTTIEFATGLPKATSIGGEFIISVCPYTDHLEFYLYGTHGTTFYLASILHNYENGTLEYYDENTVYQQFASDVYVQRARYTFHSYKLCIDIENHEYLRCLVDGYSYSLAGIPYVTTSTTPEEVVELAISPSGGDGHYGNSYLDSVIITINED